MADASAPIDMRRAILDAAAQLLADQGYKATTLRAIAAQVGVQAASLYHHFPSKDDITVEVLNLGVELVDQAITAAVAGLPVDALPAETLRAAIMAHLSALHENRAYTRAAIRCYSMVPSDIRDRTQAARRALDERWLSILQGLQHAGAIDANASLADLHVIILGGLNWTLELSYTDHARQEKLCQQLMSLVVDGSKATHWRDEV